jgi:single-stranded-DNA-specific exonuclease
MAFLFLRGLEGEVWEDMHTDRALAMMGTVADLVELRGINRQLVTSGLRSLRELRSGPLAELRDEVASGMLTSTDVAFRIAPRLNAAGRMDDPMLALHALLEGGGHMTRLHALNRERQEVTARLVEKARRDTAHVLTVLKASASKEYPHGIIGLMAGSLTESTGCPSMVGAVHGDRITASLRSPRNYHVTEGLSRIGHLLESFGGHSQAAGCSFPAVRWREVCESLERDILRMQSAGDFLPTIEVDALLSEEDVSLQLAQSLMRLEPFGQGNPEPRFLLRGVTVRETRRVGEDAKHLQMDISGVRAIGFGLGAAQERIAGPVDAVCRVGINAWQGKRSVQLVVEDIATRDEQREARK